VSGSIQNFHRSIGDSSRMAELTHVSLEIIPRFGDEKDPIDCSDKDFTSRFVLWFCPAIDYLTFSMIINTMERIKFYSGITLCRNEGNY